MDDGMRGLEEAVKGAEGKVARREPVAVEEYAKRWGGLGTDLKAARVMIAPEVMDDEALKMRVLREKAQKGLQPLVWNSMGEYRKTFMLDELEEMVRQASERGEKVSEDEALREHAGLTGVKFADEEESTE
jgi:hypothetical protein